MEDHLVYFGGEVKDLGEGKVGGYLLQFSTDKDPDLTRDYFSEVESDIEGPQLKTATYYQHGQDTKLGARVIGRVVDVKRDEVGIWVESQLNQRDEYEKAVLQMAKAGKLGYSSGALAHMVNREPRGDGVHLIKNWVIGEVSLTPTPAEPRLTVMSLKSLFPSEGAALPSEEEEVQPTKEKALTDEIDIKAVVAAALAERDAAAEVKAKEADALKTAEEAGYKKAVEELKSKNMLKVAPAYVKNPGDDNEGEMAFKSWLSTGQTNGGLIVPGPEWGSTKTAFAIGAGDTGGFLVPDPLYNRIIAKRDNASWVRQAPVQVFQTPSDHILVPVEDTKAAVFAITGEAVAYTEDEPDVNQIDIILYKLTKEIRMSEEFINFEGTNFDAWIADSISRAVAVTENYYYTIGSGTGQPQGIRTTTVATTDATAWSSLTAVAAADLTDLIASMPAGYNVPSECGFLMRNATKWIAKGAQANPFVFMSTPNGADFLGYPAYIADDLQLLGTGSAVGSVVFANFNFYGVAERPGILIQRNPYLYMATGQIGLFANIYRGGAILQGEAVVLNTNHA